jgi:type I restriction enzyme S subunit
MPEQRKIAEILNTWDKAIGLVDKQIEAKQRLKKGLTQQLLTGNTRFQEYRDKWEEMKLSDFLELQLRKVEKPKEAYLRLGVRSHGKGTFSTVVDDPESVSMDHLFKVKEGDLIVSITFAWEGAIAFVEADGNGALVSHRFPTFVIDESKVSRKFFRYLIHTPRFFYDLRGVSPGGAGRNRVLSKQSFLGILVTLPPLEEQERVGSILVIIDRNIQELACLLRELRKQKQGLMQKLLTGQVRVKV